MLVLPTGATGGARGSHDRKESAGGYGRGREPALPAEERVGVTRGKGESVTGEGEPKEPGKLGETNPSTTVQ